MNNFKHVPLLLLILALGILHAAVGESVCTPACRNGGSCVFHNTCQCPKNFAGSQCQYSVDRCAPQKIGFNGSVRCVGTSTSMSCTLSCPPGIDFDSPPATTYTCSFESGTFTPAKAPKCVYGEGFEVIQRAVDRNDLANCNPSCKNGGTCIFRDMCQCPKEFVGPQCQYSVDRCAPQKIEFNGAISCRGSTASTEMRCTLSCPPGVEFDSPPSAVYTCKYETGTYLPARVPRCVYGDGVRVIQRTAVGRNVASNSGRSASCTPSCMNGGVCIYHNLCQCPEKFRGPQCQYSVDRCSLKRTGFNGGYRCTGSVAETSCTIYCPEGTDFEFSPATTYSCKYETGRFTPSAIPKCVAGEGFEIVRV